MAEPAQVQLVVKDFPGLMDNVDPHDIPPGAAEVQINACSFVTGELRVRLGLKTVKFENDGPSS
jgi:hypothetical protein